MVATPYQQASSSSTGTSGYANAWEISSTPTKSVYSRGNDTGEIVQSTNPLEYPSNGYKKIDNKDYWFEMVVE